MSNPFVGELRLVGFNFAPSGWALAAGQLLSLSQNTALFSLLGTNYGGNGTSNFGLPNLQGNIAVGFGQLAGGQQYVLGETGGQLTVTLTVNEVTPHTHTVNASTGRLGTTPVNNAFGDSEPAPTVGNVYYAEPPPNPPLTNMAAAAVTSQGSNLPHDNSMPYQALNWVIALKGIFPSRN
jgi:microcystin-dependent protein